MSDVICYGSLIPDRVLRLPRFPRPGEGLHALNERLYLGGEPCNVGGQLAAWDVSVTLAGNNLGIDPLGAFVRDQLARRPQTTALVQDDATIHTPTCYIWTTPDGERTIIPSWPTLTGWTLPDEAQLKQARIISTSIFGPGMDDMIALAQQAEKPLAVADIAGPDDPRLPGAAIVTTSRSVLQHRHGVSDIEAWVHATHTTSGAMIVVSSGAGTVLAQLPDGSFLSADPPQITPVDTTGAGDALKAGLIFGWLQGWPMEEALRWGIAAASLACLHYGACERPASRSDVEQMLPSISVGTLNPR